MNTTYGQLIDEINGLTAMYGVENDDTEGEDDVEGDGPEYYIRDFRNSLLRIIGDKVVVQIHGKDAKDGGYSIDTSTRLQAETITSITDELAENKISDEILKAFCILLGDLENDIFEVLVDIFDNEGTQGVLNYIQSNKPFDKIDSKSLLFRLNKYLLDGHYFVESVQIILDSKGVRLEDIRKTGEFDLDPTFEQYVIDINSLLLAKIGCPKFTFTVQ